MRIVRPIVVGVVMVVLATTTTASGAPSQTAPSTSSKTQIVDVSTPNRAAKARLQRLGLDLTEHGDANSIEVVLYGDRDVKRLRDAGFSYTVRIADLAARDEANRKADERYAAATATSPLPSGRDSYRHLAGYYNDLAQLAQTYPTLARRVTLSHRSWEGRPISGIEITRNPNAADGKPVFLMMGAHHAREWPSAEHTIEFAYDLLRGYGNDARTTALVDATRTIIVPVVNPDGFVVSREARTGPPTQDFSIHDFEMKRKNCRDAVGTCDRKNRLIGVDLNRNYGGLWGGPGAGVNPLNDTYRGPAPFSEPEIQSIRDLVASRSVVMLVTNHTFSNLILRPPGTVAQGFPLEEPQLAALGAEMASRNGYANIPGFGLYDTTGATEDWTFWTAGALSYTFEIGPSEFHPPYETGVVAEYLGLPPAAGAGHGGNRAAYFDALEATADTALHSVLTGSAPAGSRLSISKSFQTLTSPVCRDDFCSATSPPLAFDDHLAASMVTSASTFTWHVNPSTRPIVAGRAGRDPVAPPQAAIAMVNPAIQPDENVYFPSTAPKRVDPPYETFTFDVGGLPSVDNHLMTVHIDWTNPANDWDVYVLDDTGAIVSLSASFGDATEDAVLVDPQPGRYTAVIVNYDQVDRQFDDWRGQVQFAAPTPETHGPDEAWIFRCEPPGGGVAMQEVVVDRGETVDVGEACQAAK